MPVSSALRSALAWGRDEQEELADEFLETKVFVYAETLAELAQAHGLEVSADDLELSDGILAALRAEAQANAQHVVDTYNADLDGFLERNDVLERDALLAAYEAWAENRADAKSELIAVSEAYSASADATLAFHTANGIEAEYDFGGHGDDDPACSVCQALQASNPHPHARVVEVGKPHLGCRQEWHAVGAELPEEVNMPDKPAGIVGSEPLVNRHGNDHDAAARAVEGLAAE